MLKSAFELKLEFGHCALQTCLITEQRNLHMSMTHNHFVRENDVSLKLWSHKRANKRTVIACSPFKLARASSTRVPINQAIDASIRFGPLSRQHRLNNPCLRKSLGPPAPTLNLKNKTWPNDTETENPPRSKINHGKPSRATM